MRLENWNKYINKGVGPTSGKGPEPKEHLDYLSGCGKVLDVGCGCGGSTEYLKEICGEVSGITMNEEEKKICLKKGLNVFVIDMHETGFGSKKFDGIMMWDVIEHSPCPWILMDEMHRILRPNGKLLAFIPAERWIECDYHLSVLNQRQARWLFENTGFEIYEMLDKGNQSAVYKLIRK